jgi:GNAT superfamily N-acetyltransferase
MASDVTVVPANEATWDDLRAIFGARGDPAHCHCQWFKVKGWAEWRALPEEVRAHRLRAQTGCGQPELRATSGLVAYLEGEPAGWCNVEPRAAFTGLKRTPIPWAKRSEDRADPTVWAITCFVTRAGFRRRGVAGALAMAAVDFARGRGARALEGYPMITEPGKEITWGELFVGSRSIFARAGFIEVSHPSLRRVVMRIDFEAAASG